MTHLKAVSHDDNKNQSRKLSEIWSSLVGWQGNSGVVRFFWNPGRV